MWVPKYCKIFLEYFFSSLLKLKKYCCNNAFLLFKFCSLNQEVQTRGAAIIKARKLSSAMSAAKAICDHMKTWWFGTEEDNYASMGVVSDGSYNIPEGIVYSFPVTVKNKEYEIVKGLTISQFSREKMDTSKNELIQERDTAMHYIEQ